MPLVSVNPATGERIREYDEHSAREVRERLEKAGDTLGAWSSQDIDTRAGVLHRVARALARDEEAHVRQITMEMGKPLREARAEVRKCVRGLRWVADHAEEALEPRELDERTRVTYEPLGTLLGIMPWNFPYWQVIRFAAPALMAGNVVLVKHASNVSGCLLSLEAAFREAGARATFQGLLMGSKRVGRLIRNPRIRGVSLTGSEEAGRKVARAAGAALKPCVLELGGSDPFLVFPDADVEAAARAAAESRCVNSGQSCIAAKRFFVEEDVHDAFMTAFEAALRDLPVGDPLDPKTKVGPLARADLRDAVARQVRETEDAGAKVRLGGHALERDGYYYAPTLLTDVPADAPALTEEVFGPVAPVVSFASEEEAVFRANATQYGLGASVWTGDAERADRLTDKLEAGLVFTNASVASDPKAPFGGVKASGFGRELGEEGFRAFVNVKTTKRRGL